jgi:hypothetical protein
MRKSIGEVAGVLYLSPPLGSIPSNAQVQQIGDQMPFPPPRFKRTTPFEKRCNFVIDDGSELERCPEEATVGFYYGDNRRVKMVSLCQYHAIYQESLWIGGME